MEFFYVSIKAAANAGYGVDQTMKKGQGTGNSYRVIGICSKGMREHIAKSMESVSRDMIQQNNVCLQLGYDGLNGIQQVPTAMLEMLLNQLQAQQKLIENKKNPKDHDE